MIFRESEIEWQGKQYKFTPTMALLSRIERTGKSLIGIQAMANSGQPQISLMAEVMGMVMRSADIEITDAELYQELLSSEAQSILDLWITIFDAISPTPKEGKKSDAQDTK